MSALRAFAVLAFSLSTVGVAWASPNGAPVSQYQSAPPAGRPPACNFDPRGSATLQGYLRVNRQSSGSGAIVQLFAGSDVADSYLNAIEQQLSSRPVTPVAPQAADTDAMTNTVTRMQARIALLQSAKFAIVGADGKFDCAGLPPGRYILLGTVVSFQGTTQRPSLTQSYFRADVTIPSANRPRTYLAPAFRLMGVAPL